MITSPATGNFNTEFGNGYYMTQGGTTIYWKMLGPVGDAVGGRMGGSLLGVSAISVPGGQSTNRVVIVQSQGGYSPSSRAGVTSVTGGITLYRRWSVSQTGTYYRSAAGVAGQGAVVRAGMSNYRSSFQGGWYAKYPGAWYPTKWAGMAAWGNPVWGTLAGWWGYPAETATSYDYGSSVVYQDNAVYVNGEQVATAAEYADQAAAIAEEGKTAEATKDEEWRALGVFAVVLGEETSSSNLYQLAVNKAGVIRGNYYHALTDAVEPVYGNVDKKTQRAAWTVGEKKYPIYEAGIVNLTEESTTMMVHYSKEKSQQLTLFRIEQVGGAAPEGASAEPPKKGP
jgi:hypothetical protein